MKAWYESQTIRALIVSAIAQLFAMLDIEGDAAAIADAVLQVVAIGALVWAAIGRKNATQPVAFTKQKEADTNEGA